ncbi:MAG: cytidylate kinase-like family protein [Planctomycetes bacterium]|nr:cytidylate kinase-like family protein [Planctomycetota bacterium]
MPGIPSGGKSDIAKFVERQVRNWELSRAQRVEEEGSSGEEEVAAFVTVSRMVGSGGSEVARLLGARFSWPVFDKQILQAMAGDNQIHTRLYETLDERDIGWLENALRWVVLGKYSRDDYFFRLSETILALARQGHAVFLGRGADLILPQDRGLRVRVVASEEWCARQYAQRHNITEALALAEVQRINRERGDFIRTHFNRSPRDPLRHDLIINSERCPLDHAVESVATLARLRGILP